MPAPRNDSADLERHRVHEQERREHEQGAPDVRQEFGGHHRRGAHAGRPRRLDELLLAQREHLAAERPGHVRHVYEPDHDIGISFEPEPIASGPTSTPEGEGGAEEGAESSAGNDQSRSNSRLMTASVRPRR